MAARRRRAPSPAGLIEKNHLTLAEFGLRAARFLYIGGKVAMSNMTASISNSADRFARRKAARYLSETRGLAVAPQTLAKYAVIGGGPSYRKFGRYPVYAIADLDRCSTSDKEGR